MPKKTMSKTQTVRPNGMSKNVNTSESEDGIDKVQKILKSCLAMNDNSSSTETSNADEKLEPDTFKSKKKKMHWMKKPFVLPTSTFTESFPTSPIYSEPEPIDYFYSMFW